MAEDHPPPSRASGRRATVAFLVVLAGIAAWYLVSIPGVLILNPDTTTYLTLARSLARGEGYTFNGAPYGKYPPVFAYLLAAVYATVGESFWAMQAVVALSGVGAVAAVYALVRAREGSRPALWVAVVTATCYWFVSHSLLVIRPDVPYALFSLTALALAERAVCAPRFSVARWGLVAAATLLAIYTRMVGATLVPAIVAGALFARGQKHSLRQRLVACVVVGVVGTAAVGYWWWRGRALRATASYALHMEAVFSERAPDVAGKYAIRVRDWTAAALSVRFKVIPWPVGVLALGLFVLPGLVDGFWRRRNAAEFYLAAYFLILSLLGGEFGHERYAVPVVGLLFYFGYRSLRILEGGARALTAKRRGPAAEGQAPRAGGRVAGIVAVALIAVALYCRYRYKNDSKFKPSRLRNEVERLALWRAAARYITQQLPPETRIYPGSGGTCSMLHFFTERHILMPRYPERGPLLLKRLLELEVDYVFYHEHRWDKERFYPILNGPHAHCFPLVRDYDKVRLYRVDREALRRVVALLGRQEET